MITITTWNDETIEISASIEPHPRGEYRLDVRVRVPDLDGVKQKAHLITIDVLIRFFGNWDVGRWMVLGHVPTQKELEEFSEILMKALKSSLVCKEVKEDLPKVKISSPLLEFASAGSAP